MSYSGYYISLWPKKPGFDSRHSLFSILQQFLKDIKLLFPVLDWIIYFITKAGGGVHLNLFYK